MLIIRCSRICFIRVLLHCNACLKHKQYLKKINKKEDRRKNSYRYEITVSCQHFPFHPYQSALKCSSGALTQTSRIIFTQEKTTVSTGMLLSFLWSLLQLDWYEIARLRSTAFPLGTHLIGWLTSACVRLHKIILSLHW